ncbi:MAG TPA: hypothetical protein VH643_22885 [Gemmataceae bacterium]
MPRFLRSIRLALLLSVALAAGGNAQPRPRTDRYDDPLPPAAIARLGTLRLRGCRGPVVFSPDGKHLIAAGGDANTQAVFWDLATGRRVKALTSKETIQHLTFSPDGKQLAAVGAGGFFNPVWDAASGKELFTFKGNQVAFSDGGKKIVSSYGFGEKTTVRSYDTVAGKQRDEWTLEHPRGNDLSLSGDGRFAAIPDEGPNLRVFDLGKKVKVKELPVKLGRIQRGAFSRDGRRLVASGEKGWIAWDWASGKSLGTWSGRVNDVPFFSPDGRRLFWIGSEEEALSASLWVVELEGGRPRRIEVIGSKNWARLAAFAPDGKTMAVLTEGNAIALLDSQTGRDLLPFDGHAGQVQSISFTSDARYVLSGDSCRVLVWETATGRLLRRLPDDLPPGETVLLNTATHGRIATVQSADNTLRLRDLVTAKELRRLKGKDAFVAAAPWDVSAVSADGSCAAILSPTGVRVYDLDNGDIRCQFTTEHPIWGMDFSADGRTLVVTIQDFRKGLLTTFRDARTGRKRETPKDSIVRKRRGGWWPGSSDETKARLQRLKLLDKTGQPAFVGEDGFIANVVESPDGRYLAVKGRTGLPHVLDPTNKQYVRIWDATTRRLVMDLEDTRGMINLGGFAPDARTFLSTTYSSGTIHLWEIATGRERLRLQGHLGGDLRLAFRLDGRALLSGGTDTQVLLWDLTGRMPDGQWRSVRQPPDKLRAAWEALASDDAKAAYAAMWQLVADAEGSTTFLRERLRPVPRPKPGQVARLIATLDAEDFAARQRAMRALETLEESASAELRQTLKGKPTLEVRRRIEALLARLERVPAGEQLQALRAIEALEQIGTPEAQKILQTLADGDPGGRATQEAKASLRRLTKRAAP